VVKFFAVSAVVLFTIVGFSVIVSAAQVGMASYYRSGKVTANGEKFNPQGLTAAHRTLPFGTKVRVVNVRTGKAVTVRINDRGPFIRGRIIDLAFGAARVVGLSRAGVMKVRLEILN
jgi:rare lipoprotein A